jgi:hypothetical protein
VAESAFGLVARVGRFARDELGVRRVGDGDGQPQLGSGRSQVFIKARERADAGVERFWRQVAGNELVAERLHILDGGAEQLPGVLGPGDAEETDEGQRLPGKPAACARSCGIAPSSQNNWLRKNKRAANQGIGLVDLGSSISHYLRPVIACRGELTCTLRARSCILLFRTDRCLFPIPANDFLALPWKEQRGSVNCLRVGPHGPALVHWGFAVATRTPSSGLPARHVVCPELGEEFTPRFGDRAAAAFTAVREEQAEIFGPQWTS